MLERMNETLGSLDTMLASEGLPKHLPELYAGGHELVRTLFIAGLLLVLILFALLLFFRRGETLGRASLQG
jgi:hypothetical protein